MNLNALGNDAVKEAVSGAYEWVNVAGEALIELYHEEMKGVPHGILDATWHMDTGGAEDIDLVILTKEHLLIVNLYDEIEPNYTTHFLVRYKLSLTDVVEYAKINLGGERDE